MDNDLCLILSIHQNVLLTSATGIPANFVVLLIMWYFHVVKGYSLDSIKQFTMFHFVNMDINGNETYSNYWALSCLEYQLLSLYSRKFRIGLETESQVLSITGMNQMTPVFFESRDVETTTIIAPEQISKAKVRYFRFLHFT